jgi:hypothetical protein
MTREEVIECMAFGAFMSAYPDSVWEKSSEVVKNLYRDKMEAGLAALESRGMVIVPKKNIAEWAEFLDATVQSKGGWAWEDVLDEMRAMTEAYNG